MKKRFKFTSNEKWVIIAEDEDEAIEKLREQYEDSPLDMFEVKEINKNDVDWEFGE